MKLQARTAVLLLAVVALGGCRHGDSNVAQVRLIDAVPGPEPLSVSVNDKSVWKHSTYQDNSGYQKVQAGSYDVSLAAGDLEASKAIALEKDHLYTVIALKTLRPDALTFRVFPDDPTAPVPDGKTELHLINAAQVPGGVDVLVNNIVAFPAAAFAHRSESLFLDAGDYDVKVNAPDSVETLSGPVSLHFEEGQAYTLVVMGTRAQGVVLGVYPDDGGGH